MKNSYFLLICTLFIFACGPRKTSTESASPSKAPEKTDEAVELRREPNRFVPRQEPILPNKPQPQPPKPAPTNSEPSKPVVSGTTELKNIMIYGSLTCGWCVKAKQLLDGKGIPYTFLEFSKMSGEEGYKIMQRAGGQTTIPMIFIDDKFIGGFRELEDLLRKLGM